MTLDRTSIITLYAVGVVFLIVALQGFLVPRLFMAPVEIELTNASALAEVRAGYGGCFGALACVFFLGARCESWRRSSLGVGGVVLSVFVMGRLLSLAVDGMPNLFSLGILAAEATGATACVWQWRKKRLL